MMKAIPFPYHAGHERELNQETLRRYLTSMDQQTNQLIVVPGSGCFNNHSANSLRPQLVQMGCMTRLFCSRRITAWATEWARCSRWEGRYGHLVFSSGPATGISGFYRRQGKRIWVGRSYPYSLTYARLLE